MRGAARRPYSYGANTAFERRPALSRASSSAVYASRPCNRARITPMTNMRAATPAATIASLPVAAHSSHSGSTTDGGSIAGGASVTDGGARPARSEAGYSQERAAVVLHHPGLIIAAFDGDALVGIVRVLTDGLAAAIMEFSVDLALQGSTAHGNGSLIEADQAGLAARLGQVMLVELAARQVDFITYDVVEGSEESFFKALGFQRNTGMINYIIDRRPYVSRG
jgi:hypothetical protein